MKGIDCAEPISAEKAKELYADDVDFVCRYYSHNAAKNLTRAEAQAISDAGLLLITVWEAQGDQYSSFGTVMGTADGVAAKRQAQACGQPEGSAIYFAVDFDATQWQIDRAISDYFAAVKSVIGGYLVGSYGSPLVNASLAAKGLAVRSWRAQSTGWAGDHSQPADIVQGPEQRLLGLDVDTDSTTEAASRIGAWSLPPAAPVQPPVLPAAPDDVRDLIKQLQAATGATPDGILGPETIAKVEAWQDAH